MTAKELVAIFDNLPQGWLSLSEAVLLVHWAEQTDGPILEVGSYYGRSAVLLSHVREVLCIDPWQDCGEFVYGPGVTGDEVYEAFKQNVFNHPVSWFRDTIEKVRLPPWSFMFWYLDGDHSYQGTLNQIDRALSHLPKIIAVHDVNDTGGGAEIKRACIERLGPWTERVERLAIWDRR